MSTPPSFAYLMLDSNNDPVFADGTSLTGAAAVEQSIVTRLNLFLGEWWADLNIGLPVFQQMLGQLGSQHGLTAMTLAVQQNVESGPFVTSALCTTTFTNNSQLNIRVAAQTVFGTVIVNYTPGLQANLGG
jgi:hypothetical protein